MKPETERLLATLEILCHNPSDALFWETEKRGEFSLLKFMQQQGFIKLTDLEVAVENWQETELRGTADRDDYYYAPEPEERINILDEETKTFRSEKYRLLLQTLASNLTEIQAFNISASHLQKHSWQTYNHYNFCAVIGKTKDKDWLCLAPTVPNQVFYYSYKSHSHPQAESTESLGGNTKKLLSQIQDIISELTPTLMYGYYGGGYDYTYHHQIFCQAATKKELVFELALSRAGMLKFSSIENMNNDDKLNVCFTLNQFLNSKLDPLHAYELAFWNLGYVYKFGKNSAGDWLGVRSFFEFEYNP
ncbi:MAG: hypothetical protein SXA11_11725 [Cyanobacteriota bacterium]|nr:hypothetical protein [Cyanobacteriota bacterium]